MIRILAKRDFNQYIQLVKTFRPIDDYICQGGFNEIYDYIFQNSKIFVYVIDKEIVGSVKKRTKSSDQFSLKVIIL